MYIGLQLPEEDGHHVTVTFHGHGESKRDYIGATAALADAAFWWNRYELPPINLNFGKLSCFPDSGAWHTTVQGQELHWFRNLLTDKLTERGVYWSNDFDYVPHVTLAYFEKPSKNPYQGISMPVKKLAVVSNNFGVTEVMLG